MTGITQAVVAPNFTENGWGLTRAPSNVVELLKESLTNNLANAEEEYQDDAIVGIDETWKRPLFIEQLDLNRVVLNELRPMHETWAGIPLIGEVAYGLRVYRNQTILHMHGTPTQEHLTLLC
jgi:hypothetical protein